MKLITTAALVLAVTTSAWADAPITLDFEGAVGYVNSIGDILKDIVSPFLAAQKQLPSW